MPDIEFLAERISHWNQIHKKRKEKNRFSAYYHAHLAKTYKHLIGDNARVLEIGCGRGDLLASLKPKRGVGIDFSKEAVERARANHPDLTFIHCEATLFEPDETFDYIILSDIINDLWDVQLLLSKICAWCAPETRVIINSFSRVWQLPISLGKALGAVTPTLVQNWFARDDLLNLMRLEGFEIITNREEILWPVETPFLSVFFNKYLSKIFPFNLFGMTFFVTARVPKTRLDEKSSVSVIIAARNEEGNIKKIFDSLPALGGETEFIFVEGNSTDGTYNAIQREIEERKSPDVRLIKQDGKGKGDAVRKGFSHAKGDVLMILDADLTVSPEYLPRFFDAIITAKAEYVNGVRLVYPMDKYAMRFMNLLGNKFFSLAFSWLLNRPIKDTLCGTKVISRYHYERIAENRHFFGDFDPFGDFDLIFGAAKLNLKFIDLPIRYKERVYGETNISRWSHGWLLLKMVFFAMKKIKFH